MIWFHRSEFFEMALSGEWTERKEKKMVLKDCSAEALIVAVNFIYGISVPEDFTQYGDLLHLAELFQMENLKGWLLSAWQRICRRRTIWKPA